VINCKRVLAVVPARGGSKGIPLKNLQPVNGVPMVALVGRVLALLPEVDRAVVSTDNEEIAVVAEAAGLAAPFRRPEALSGDRIGDIDVLVHALETCEKLDGVQYDIVLMLQPTSPLREPWHVRDCVQKLVDGSWDAVWTVSPTDTKGHPLKQLMLENDGGMDYYDSEGANIIARQQLKPLYHRNGIAYAFTRDCLLNQRTIKGARTAAVVIDGEHVSIDTMWDLELVEFILSRRAGRSVG
jgi:CMP-N,N'-diacetyllegionaminic acid synthase